MTRDSEPEKHSSTSSWRRFAGATILLACVWVGLNGADLASWLVGAPAVVAVAAVATWLPVGPPLALRWLELPPFALFFILRSLRGGWDVARRVLHRRLLVAPGYLHFDTSLPPGPARHLFLNAISLLPGTVTAGVEGDRIVIHVIDVHAEPEAGIRELEMRVARLFTGMGRTEP